MTQFSTHPHAASHTAPRRPRLAVSPAGWLSPTSCCCSPRSPSRASPRPARHLTDQARRPARGASLDRTLAAGYLESLSFFVLTPAIVLIAYLFSRRTTVGRFAAQSFTAFGVAFVASTLAVGFPAGAAALYAAHHGVDAGSIATVNDIRNYSFVLQVALNAAMALALGVAALAERVHTRWVGWGGIVVGVGGLIAVPFAQNTVSSAWMIWWVGMAVLLLRQNSPHE